MKCQSCGAEIDSNSERCEYCGSEIVKESPNQIVNVTNNYNSDSKVKWLILGAALLIACVVVSLFIFSKRESRTVVVSYVENKGEAVQSDDGITPAYEATMVRVKSIDYKDVAKFEEDLCAGKNLEGKTVTFTVNEFHPDSAYGYNLWAGEHLNFVSSRHPNVGEGDKVSVRADKILSVLNGHWIIYYTFVELE